MNKTVGYMTLKHLAYQVCQKCNMQLDTERLRIAYDEEMPLILTNAQYRVWIDKYYLAVQELHAKDVKYLYISRAHIEEETENYKAVGMRLPSDIDAAFQAAVKYMGMSRSDIWIKWFYPSVKRCA